MRCRRATTHTLDQNAGRRCYSWFEENGGLTRANGQRFLGDMVLSRGKTYKIKQNVQTFPWSCPQH